MLPNRNARILNSDRLNSGRFDFCLDVTENQQQHDAAISGPSTCGLVQPMVCPSYGWIPR